MMKAQISNMLQQAQKLQAGVQKAQQEIENLEATGQAGAGLVSIVMNGKYSVRKVHIDDSLLEDQEMLEDLLAAACNDAAQKVRTLSQEKLSQATGGLPIPPGWFG